MRTLLQLSTLSTREESLSLLDEMFRGFYVADPLLFHYHLNFPFQNYSLYQVHGGDTFYLDQIPDLIKSYLRKGVTWESHIGYLIERFTSPGSVAIDLGGHIGIHTLQMSRSVGLEGKVYVFEPQMKLFTELVINMHLNGVSNVTCFRKAVGACVEEVEMEPHFPCNEGGMGIGQGGDVVESVPLDDFHLENVSLIKIDVEGAEESVIEGARKTILRNRPTLLIEIMGSVCYEVATDEQRAEIHRRAARIEQLGYRVVPIRGNNYLGFPI